MNNVEATIPEATIEYKVGDRQWTTEVPSATDVADSMSGTISVRARLEGYETITLENRSIIVTQKAVTVTANAAEKLFGRDDPTFTAQTEGTIGSDTVTYTVSRPGAGTEEKEAVGVYEGAVVPTGAVDQGNYHVTYVQIGRASCRERVFRAV